MHVGVGTNATIPGVAGEDILTWARRADDGPFSTLGIIDRIAYSNHEPLATLAALAAVTTRIHLTTTVLVAPIRSTGLLAKQTATIDAISGGRLTLGLGIGGREEDYVAAGSGTDFGQRARVLEEQVATMRRLWNGQPLSDDIGPIGPLPARDGGPAILLGGYSTPAARRAGEIGDGFIAGNLPPEKARAFYEDALAGWRDAGREGRPRFVTCGYFALGGDDAVERGRDNLRDYYGFREGGADRAAASMLDSADAVSAHLEACEEHGVDEVILWPAVPDVDQLDRFAEVVTGR